MKLLKFFKNTQKRTNFLIWILVLLISGVVIWGVTRADDSLHIQVIDNIQHIDLDTIYLESSGVEITFSDVIISPQNEIRKLVVSTQTGAVSIKLTDRLIEQLDFDFLKKTQSVSYTGTGYFVVDLDNLTVADIIDDKENRTVIIRIEHSYLETIDINPDDVIIDEVEEGLLARGKIKLTVADYKEIEKDLLTELEAKFNTVANGQRADDLALEMVKNIYEPIVKTIDPRYSVRVEFK